jgi:hypothetical protein
MVTENGLPIAGSFVQRCDRYEPIDRCKTPKRAFYLVAMPFAVRVTGIASARGVPFVTGRYLHFPDHARLHNLEAT